MWGAISINKVCCFPRQKNAYFAAVSAFSAANNLPFFTHCAVVDITISSVACMDDAKSYFVSWTFKARAYSCHLFCQGLPLAFGHYAAGP